MNKYSLPVMKSKTAARVSVSMLLQKSSFQFSNPEGL